MGTSLNHKTKHGRVIWSLIQIRSGEIKEHSSSSLYNPLPPHPHVYSPHVILRAELKTQTTDHQLYLFYIYMHVILYHAYVHPIYTYIYAYFYVCVFLEPTYVCVCVCVHRHRFPCNILGHLHHVCV